MFRFEQIMNLNINFKKKCKLLCCNKLESKERHSDNLYESAYVWQPGRNNPEAFLKCRAILWSVY
jgi:hypothetical protein